MTERLRISTIIVLSAMINMISAIAQAAQPAQSAPAPTAAWDTSYSYQLFPTTSIWTQVLLDTSTGRAWQVQYSIIGDAPYSKVLINGASLLPLGAHPKSGRFTLSQTPNMYAFLLLDRQDGRMWQLEWSIEPERPGMVRSIDLEK